jgi:phosphoribosyl-ATP pyrophosphohydrolase
MASKDVKFDPTNFNTNFEKNDKSGNRLVLVQKNLEEEDLEIIVSPHKQPVENIILNIRDLFFQVLSLIEDRENPIPFIFASDKRQFSFALFLIIFGTLLLLLSSLMKSPTDK